MLTFPFHSIPRKSREDEGPLLVQQERMKVREVIPHIGPIPIVIPLKLFLDLPRDPVSQEG